jgi:cell division protein FtsB
VSRSRLLGALVLLGAVVFALAGGEYGTLDWLELRREEQQEQRTIEELQAEVDSLRRYAHAVETDRRVMERLARENFGMIRKGEFLYRLEADTVP